MAAGNSVMADSKVVSGNSNDIVFSVENITHSYGQTKALSSCSFSLKRGEVHALIGENGSGKSTLVKIISGIIAPDSGKLTINNVERDYIATPLAAHQMGIGTSFQEILIVPELSVLDNVWLGVDPRLLRALSEAQRRVRVKEVLQELLEEEPPLDEPIGRLEISRQQLCVIARALINKPKIVVLDEPTAALDVSDTDRLFSVIRRLAREGVAFIFISHRMDEIIQIADRATVLRAGCSVGTLDKEKITPQALIEMMSGECGVQCDREMAAKTAKVRMRISDLQVTKGKPFINLEARTGEIIGVAGLEGHGQDKFISILAGLRNPLHGTITVVTDKGERRYKSIREASNYGIVYVPRNRKTAGIFEPLSILDNFALPALRRYSSGLFMKTKQLNEDFDKYHEKLSIRMSEKRFPISTLSGGNQQKILIARWLNMNPSIIIFNDPTRGVDPKTKLDIYQTASDLAANGTTIIFLSTDVEELVHLVDRVWVFRDGTLEEEIPRDRLTNNAIISAFFGHKEHGQKEQK
jgi:ABC-type sugar transport system ATPase subunit